MDPFLRTGTKFRKDVETIAPRISFEGNPATHRDAMLFAECLVLREALVIDLFDDECSAAAYRRALLSLREIDAKAFCSCVKDFYSSLTQEEFLITGDWQIFKQSVAALPQWFVAPPLRYLQGKRNDPLEVQFQKLLQWAKFDSKLNFKGTPVYEEAVAYLDDEATMRSDPVDYGLLGALHDILVEWTSDFPDEATPFMGVHSSGAVTGIPKNRATPESKTRAMRMTPSLEKYIRYRNFNTDPFKFLDQDERPLVAPPLATDLEQAIDVIFVPKNPLTRRVVSPEDAMHMYCQSDAAALLTQWINRFHWSDLSDQSKPRKMCLQGSKAGEYVTVDSSKASDFVRVTHAEVILRGTPIFPLVMWTRSKYARVTVPSQGGEPERTDIIELEKLAPMGSKTCFLMEQTMFALSCELAVRLVAGRRSKEGDFFVYGDDTIIRQIFWPTLRLILALLRFRVNNTKTFDQIGRLIFRESCGLFAVNGREITPYQVSRRYNGLDAMLASIKERRSVGIRVPEATEALAVIDSLNRLTVFGLNCVRRWVYTFLRDQEWLRLIYRIDIQTFLRDEERIFNDQLHSWRPTPFLLTYGHVDLNFNLPSKMGRYKGKATWVVYQEHLEVCARGDGKAEDRRNDDLAFFHYYCTRQANPHQDDWEVRYLYYLRYGAEDWLKRYAYDTMSIVPLAYRSKPRLVWRRRR